MKKLFALLLLAASVSDTYAQQAIKEKEVKRIVSTLAADDMMGRKPGTPGAFKAASFIEEEFKKAGLGPLSGMSLRQDFKKYQLIQQSATLTVNGATKNWPVTVVGKARNIDWQADTANFKIVHVKSDRALFALARKGGKLDMNTLVWVDPSIAHMVDLVKEHISEKFYENPADIDNIQPMETPYNMVFAVEGEPVADDSKWTVKAERVLQESPFTNVVGVIQGTTKPDEYVVFSGHYDHLGIVPGAPGADSIANGADDDASGVTAVIELANYFRGTKPARSLIFVAFTGEESGGHGSQYFSRKLAPEKVVAMFNIEMIGKESKFGKNSAFITGFDLSDFGKILQRNLNGSTFKFYPDPYPEQNLFYRSDNATLARLGVPAHTVSTTQIDKDQYYHTVGDELQTLDVTNITDIIRAIAISATSIVNGTDTPTRIKQTQE
ncbi:Peptidase family M28 [Chitinophaga jiangningensis]|uniref:Peptidase family M28 n=1 Tax=Chitinophaga jiangningensis TaxID=1419482 RepID=A0A1M7H5X8_9BACT|nr:M20/M25/M40 family metallo-hydrolase [Chitinophaga jiangningensis]SHM23729.1 Peptidase family M28 [Chitinophaga jiangningensis]